MLQDYSLLGNLYRSKAIQVDRYRAKDDSHGVIVKQLQGAVITSQDIARARYEYDIMQALAASNVPNVPRPVHFIQRDGFVGFAMEDIAGTPLASLPPGTLTTSDILYLAIAVVQALEGMHRAQIIHKDVTRNNIIFNRDSRAVQLIDFNISTRLTHEMQTVDNLRLVEGTPAYLSPEQTGRLNRLLDYRADFYSLGVVLFELFAGRLPFIDDNVSTLVHKILTAQPPSLEQIAPHTPAPVAAMVARLLSKSPEGRYQSAQGLRHDLEHCLSAVAATGNVPPFALGQHDKSQRFEIPQRLYGREEAVATLAAAYAQAAQGNRRIVLLAGPSGIGKSALVGELQAHFTEHDALFAPGKYDQQRRHVPFHGFAAALTAVVRRILLESDADLSKWRAQLQGALGSIGRALTLMVPALEALVGPQPAIKELGPQENENRLLYVLQRAVAALCREQPLVLFIDDLQWADAGTLKLLETLAQDTSPLRLLIVGAYRNDEVDETHPMTRTMARLGASSAPPQIITLRPLALADVVAMLRDTTSANADVEALAELVLVKTGGNAFFVRAFVQSLYEKNFIQSNEAGWHWDIEALRTATVTENVANLMTRRLVELPAPTRAIVNEAACLGSDFELSMLSFVSDKTPADVGALLQRACEDGIILPLAAAHRYAGASGDVRYKFAHDKLQQAAYEDLSRERKASTHLRIGRKLLHNVGSADASSSLFPIVTHLNRAAALVTDPNERSRLAELNLAAAKSCRQSAAYALSSEYLDAAENVLADLTSETAKRLRWSIALERADVECCSGLFEVGTKHLEALLRDTPDEAARVGIQMRRIHAAVAVGQPREALRVGLEVLSELGLQLPRKPGKLDVLRHLLRLERALRGRSIAALSQNPPLVGVHNWGVQMVLLSSTVAAASVGLAEQAVVSINAARWAILHGNSNGSAASFVAIAAIYSKLGRWDKAHAFNEAARSSITLWPTEGHDGSIMFCNLAFIDCTAFSASRMIEAYGIAAKRGEEDGELSFPAWNALMRQSILLEVSLDEFDAHSAELGAMLVRQGQPAQRRVYRAQMRAAALLRGRATTGHDGVAPASDPVNDNDVSHDMTTLRALMVNGEIEPAGRLALALCGRGALGARYNQDAMLFATYAALALTQHMQTAGGGTGAQRKARRACLGLLDRLSKSGGAVARGLRSLVVADIDALTGKHARAEAHFEEAARLLSEAGYVSFVAMTHERAGRHYARRNLHLAAQAHLWRARAAYLDWGATTKAQMLTRELGTYFNDAAPSGRSSAVTTARAASTTTGSRLGDGLDIDAILGAAQALFTEVHVDKLAEKIMTSLLQVGGATRGALLLDKEGELHIAAEYPPQQKPLPRSVLTYVQRSHEPVLLDNAGQSAEFRLDPYIAREQPKSILCAPVMHQGKLKGAIYLENDVVTGAFTDARLRMVNLLAAQAAISLDNAYLYGHLEQTVATRTEELRKTHEQLLQMEKESTEIQMAGGFAHEIRNALAAARYSIEAALEPMAPDTDAALQAATTEAALQEAARGIGRCFDITAKILDYAQVGRIVRGGDEVDVGGVLDKLLRDMQTELQAAQVQVDTTRVGGHHLPMREEHAYKVLHSLLSNARDAVCDNRAQPTRRIEVQATEEDGRVVVAVRDSGVGIDPAIAGRIFQPFFSTKGAAGSGLALSLSRRLATLYGGTLTFDSRQDGTTFQLSLPTK